MNSGSIESIIEAAVARGVADALGALLLAPAAPAAGEPFTCSIEEGAQLLGVSQSTMYSLSHREDFPACITIGRKRLLLRHKLLEWAESKAGRQQDDGA